MKNRVFITIFINGTNYINRVAVDIPADSCANNEGEKLACEIAKENNIAPENVSFGIED